MMTQRAGRDGSNGAKGGCGGGSDDAECGCAVAVVALKERGVGAREFWECARMGATSGRGRLFGRPGPSCAIEKLVIIPQTLTLLDLPEPSAKLIKHSPRSP